MGEKATEDGVSTVPDQLEGVQEEEKNKGGSECKEKVRAGEEENVAAFLAPKPDQMKDDAEERPASKSKPKRLQTVFSLVRDQIRSQACHEVSTPGTMQLAQLDRTKVEQGEFEDTSPGKEVQGTRDFQDETTVQTLAYNETREESKKDECMDLLQEILSSIEGLRKEVADEINLLRQESQSNTDKMLQELVKAKTNPSVSVPSLPEAPKRHLLRRTLTSMAPKTSTAQAFRDRCMSEPVGGRNVKITSTRNGTSSMSSLLPSVVATQHAKKPVLSKPRVNKPRS